MIIKKYIDFINEKMGVPDKIIDSATNLYNLILTDFEKKSGSNETISDMVKGGFSGEYQIDLPIKIQISDLSYNSAELEVILHPVTSLEEGKVDVISWGVLNMPDSQDDYKLYYDKKLIDKVNMRVNFAVAEDAKFSDIYDYLNKDRAHTIGILTHELKHTYDKYMFGKSFLQDIVDYQIWSQTRTGFRAIDDFIYYLYIISKTESLVRSSEIAGELVTSDITKSDFREFIENNSTYKKLIKIKHFTYEGLKEELKQDIEKVRGLFKDLTNETDEEVIQSALDITYRMIIGESAEKLSDMLRLNDPKFDKLRELEAIIFGMSKDDQFFQKYLRQRIFNNTNEFFLYWEKKLNFEAEKVIKKIIKLYDMCKDDVVNPLMAKINSRIEGQCIVNPKLYNELIAKPNTKYNAK
jgi:hypothetical protein